MYTIVQNVPNATNMDQDKTIRHLLKEGVWMHTDYAHEPLAELHLEKQ